MNKNLYVGNVSFKVTDEDLKTNFSEAGEVVSASIIKDKFTGQSKGFGFVEMKTEEGATEAIKKFNGGMLDGKAITVNEARPKKEFGAGGGGTSAACCNACIIGSACTPVRASALLNSAA